MRSSVADTSQPEVWRHQRGSGEAEDGEREDEHVEHGHLHVISLDLLAEIFRSTTDHETGDEDREDDEDQHAVKPRPDSAEYDFAEHDVHQRNQAAKRHEGVVHAVDCAAACIRRDSREESRVGDAESDLFAFHVSARLQRRCVLVDVQHG